MRMATLFDTAVYVYMFVYMRFACVNFFNLRNLWVLFLKVVRLTFEIPAFYLEIRYHRLFVILKNIRT